MTLPPTTCCRDARQRWSRFWSRWSADSLDTNEAPFTETHEGGAEARTLPAIRAMLDAELTSEHKVAVPWSFSVLGTDDEAGWSYSSGRSDSVEWHPAEWMGARTRRRVWYSVAYDPIKMKDLGEELPVFGANIPVDDSRRIL